MKSCLIVALMALSASVWAADVSRGQAIAQQCASCHGADGNSASPAYPKLAGQHSAYLLKQLQDFKSGSRANGVMASQVANLSAADLAAVAGYFSAQPAKAGQATDLAKVEAGRKLYRGGNKLGGVPACMACHSANGAGMPAQYPRLSGQHAAYIEAQLKAYRDGGRKNDGGSVMQDIARRMTEDEMKAVAEYVAGLK